MTTEAQKTELLEDFQKYLAQSHPEVLASVEQPDLHTLLAELTGLKTEVKVESRQFKNTLDTLGSALDTVQEDNKVLANELATSAERFKQQQTDIMRTMLLEMVDLYDRLHIGVEVLRNYRPVNALFKHSRQKDVRFIERFRQGQEMTTRRFEQLLQRYQVSTVDCIDQLLDPETMTAVATGEDPKLVNGMVLEELRKGFLYQGQVLRLAEVKVNKIKHE
ncbi:MAG: nucleotide exchange factor GrpE [Gammaproteobacteria bacterium]|jgi:molecular chaperone GrpE|nr:nucleotide exchange factor GrpE [Gammaproteobacteria bacterium]MBT4145907.1 nucleotide exchange factor GrpE [Gammaproteobacteria bacterium]MBT5223729.1 nucleotide exchange factor GrpE [Gammaproteobacteria bacterium]MBT5826507.1 nucleotide exchange factor GrpE [Gammaproteobacteria bacterium]MBT5967373.1 nucleotide exchange factor GrpE [Gammaproteobacteria bacterium]